MSVLATLPVGTESKLVVEALVLFELILIKLVIPRLSIVRLLILIVVGLIQVLIWNVPIGRALMLPTSFTISTFVVSDGLIQER